MKNRNTKKGFTLIELLVVIAIIGLLATIAAVALNNARQSSRDTKRLADVKQLQTALELFFNSENAYPYDAQTACDSPILVSNIDGTCPLPADTLKTFIGGLDTVKEPGGQTDACTDTNKTVCDYSYKEAGTSGSLYEIRFYLEGATGGLLAGGVKATPSGMVNY